MIDITNKTAASLLASMLLRINEEVNKREGSLIRTALSAAAWAIEGIYIELAGVQRSAFGTTATGEYLNLKAAERGLYRIPATQSVYEVYANLNTLPIGFQMADSAGYTWEISTAVISGPDASGNYKYNAACQTAGVIPEPSGSLRSLSFYAGLTTLLFGNVVVPGEDEETDDELRTRYLESLVEIAFAGNVAAYREKILELVYTVTGGTARVGALQVYPTTDTDGTEKSGAVKIYIVDSNLQTASSDLINAVQAAICPMYNGVAVADGFGFAPIGAAVTIFSSTTKPTLVIDIVVTLNSGSTIESVTPEIVSNIKTYIANQKKNWGSQVTSRTAQTKLTISEAFVYAASIVQGVQDVSSVTFTKGGTVVTSPVVFTTSATSMEWLDDDKLTINVTT